MEVANFAKNHFKDIFLKEIKITNDDITIALRNTYFKIDELMTTNDGNNELRKLAIKSNEEDEKFIKKLPNYIKPEENYINKQLEVFKELFDPRSQESFEVAKYSGCTACVCVIIEEKVYIANAGDSRAIIIKNDKIGKKTTDHKPDLNEEKKRIIKAGGWITDNRVKGNSRIYKRNLEFE